MLDDRSVRYLMVTRYLFEQARENFRNRGDASAIVAASLLQDAIEIFLLAVAVKFDKDKPERFDKLILEVSTTLAAEGLPPLILVNALREINKVRVLAKHNGVVPNRDELERHLQEARTFLDEMARVIFGADIWLISLTALLSEGPVRSHLDAAEAAHRDRRYRDALIECRKAFYLVYEAPADCRPGAYIDTEVIDPGVDYAPLDARRAGWMELHVADPFGWIVAERNRITRDLVAAGIDVRFYDRVRRLTPSLYRWDADTWGIAEEAGVFAPEGIEGRAAVALETVVSMMLARQRIATSDRNEAVVFAKLKRGPNGERLPVQIYAKADVLSEPRGFLPASYDEIEVQKLVPGLNGVGRYWKIWRHLMPTSQPDEPVLVARVLSGYVPFAFLEAPEGFLAEAESPGAT